MKLSDYVINFLASIGVRHVFLITGGAVIHLVDSFRNNKNIDYICVQHEQAAAMAADAYTRVGNSIGVAMATSGPGATNLITGIGCSWFDSIPCLYITGQVNTYESVGKKKVRQVGFQETDIVSISKPLTKFSYKIDDPKKIRYYLEKAVYIATSGRPGPVLLDIPLDVQRAEINPDELEGYKKEEISDQQITDVKEKVKECVKLIQESKRPVILAGGGIRNAKATKELKKIAEISGIPVVVTFNGLDSFSHDNELYAGFIGVYGQRDANFTIANSDLLIGIGTRLDSRQTGTKPETFARKAKKIIVDIDPEELNQRVKADIAISCEAKLFLELLIKEGKLIKKKRVGEWKKKIKEWRTKYPICKKEYYDLKEKVNPYVFMKTLSEELAKDDIVIVDTGANLMWGIQTLEPKDNQRVFSAGGMSPMGYSFPAAIGASVCFNKKPVICTIGDGGMQINIQELQTVKYYDLPIKVFIINNKSYGIIKQYQELYLDSRYEASDYKKGYSCPDFVKIAEAYGIKTETIKNHSELREKIRKVLDASKAVVCDVEIHPDSRIIPKLEVNNPIEDQKPYLDREEFKKNMIIEPFEEK